MSSYSFCYSDRPGTKAALLPHKIPQEVKLERLSRLQALQERLGQAYLQGRVGHSTTVLLEGKSRNPPTNATVSSWQGRDPYGVTVNIPLATGTVGDMVTVQIVEAKRHTLSGELTRIHQ